MERTLTAKSMGISNEKSRYETLVDVYNTSLPASLELFRKEKVCVIAKNSSPDDLINLKIATQGEVVTPAKPARSIPAAGPLFPAKEVPATPAVVTNEKLVIGTGAGRYGKDILNVFQNSVTDKDFIIFIPKNNQGVFSDIGDNIKVSLRFDRAKNIIPLKVERNADSENKEILFMGYCY